MRRRTGPTEGGGGAAARSNEYGMSWLHGEPARDDRGRVVETLSVRAIRSANVGKAPAALAKQLRDIVKNRAAGFDPMNLVISLVLVLLVLLGLYLLPLRGLPFYGALVAFVFVQIRILRWCAERRMAREVAGTIAAHGLCGSCAYTMQDLPPDPDGCVLCPECGSAWEAERMTRAHWLPEKATLFARRYLTPWALLTLSGLGAMPAPCCTGASTLVWPPCPPRRVPPARRRNGPRFAATCAASGAAGASR